MKPSDACRITVTKNGPYFVDGTVPLTVESIICDEDGESQSWRLDTRLEDHERCGLCRCGQSGSKPMCDGTHAGIGLDGTEVASKEPYAQTACVTEGPRIDLADERDICADARFCHRLGAAWHRVLEDSDEAEEIVREECDLCPSGRYTAVDKATGEYIERQLEPGIVFVQDTGAHVSGPIHVRGGIEVFSAEGVPYEVRNRVTLCRCGHSQNKPFCDGSHVGHGFHDGLHDHL